MPIGTEVEPSIRGVSTRVWAPEHADVTFLLETPTPREVRLERGADGYHTAQIPDVPVGAHYRFRLADSTERVADPASRYQPTGPHGPSEVVDPSTFAWTDQAWRGIARRDHVIYELHPGTFTPEGTWDAAGDQLGFLAELGVTTLELMPVAAFAGRHNWGYDGVNLFAPSHTYGTPDQLRRFVDRAHAAGIAVILDVVYNHFGPDGSSLVRWSPHYRADVATEWGDAINFDGPRAAPVRELVIANAGYWIDEFHLDGLRLDATQAIHDRSPEHVLAAITRRAREAGAGREIFVVGENEPQDCALLAPPISLDALWNDDYHHTARVALTGQVEGYLHDYRGTPQELISAVTRGFLYQGQLYPWQRNPRGTPTRGYGRDRFVQFLENHDQVANNGFGERLAELADPALLRALTALTLLSPSLPLLFQGQETGARQPWRFFADHHDALREGIRRGRASFVAQFPRLATPEAQDVVNSFDPCAAETFTACVLDPAARTFANPTARMYRDLLRLRRTDAAFTDPSPGALEGAVLGPSVFALRFFQPDPGADRLLLVNLGATFAAAVVPEPLIAPPSTTGWRRQWSSEDPAYGGHGTPRIFDRVRLAIPARAAVVLAPDALISLRQTPPPASGDHDPVEP